MIVLQLKFMSEGKACTAAVELQGIAASWDAEILVQGHPSIEQFHIKYWLGNFLEPVFDSREVAIFFEPLFLQIEEQAAKLLPKEFDQG